MFGGRGDDLGLDVDEFTATRLRTVADAFLAMYQFETVCMIQVRAQAGGGELIHIQPEIIATAAEQARVATRGMGSKLSWPGLLRKLDKRSPGYDT